MVILQVHSFAELNHLAETAVLKTLGIDERELIEWGDYANNKTTSSKDKSVKPEETDDASEKSLELLNSLKPKAPARPKPVGLPPPPKPPSMLMARLIRVGQRIRIDLVARSAHKAFETVSL
jgi:hypothetical protein